MPPAKKPPSSKKPPAPPKGLKPPPGGPPKKGLAAWLKTREGKVVAGGLAVGAVVMLALFRRGGGGGGGVPADELQGAFVDGTLQDRLDQFSGAGGTVEELLGSGSELAGAIDKLTDLLEQQNPLPSDPSTPSTPGGDVAFRNTKIAQLTKRRSNYLTELRNRIKLRNALKRQPAKHFGTIKKLEREMQPLQRSIGIVEGQIRQLQAGRWAGRDLDLG